MPAYRIRIDTMNEANKFAEIASAVPGMVVVSDGQGLRVNAKSILGVLHAMEFENLWCESTADIFSKIREFIIEE